MALIVLDASVVIAQLDRSDRHHHEAASVLRTHAGDDVRLPASAYSEVLVKPATRGELAVARADIERLLLHIEPIGKAIAESAAALRAANPPLRLPDALVIACGEVLDADAVVTTDQRWARFGDRVRVLA